MPDELTPVFEVDLGPDIGNFVFNNLDELEKFVTREKAFWSWVDSIEATKNRNFSVSSWLSNGIGEIVNAITSLKSDFPIQNTGMATAFKSYFVEKKIPLSVSKLGKFIDNTRREDSEHAYLCLDFLGTAAQHATHSVEKFRAASSVAGLIDGQNPRTPSAIKSSLSAMEKEFRAKNDELGRLAIDLKLNFERQKDRFDSLEKAASARLVQSAKRLGDRTITHNRDKVEAVIKDALASIESLENTKKAYSEFMTLGAPVTYWKTKSERHFKNAKKLRWVLVLFAAFGGGALIFEISRISEKALLIDENVHSVAYFSQITVGLILATITFWIARIMTRLFLSQNHLAIDAEERATMVETYLALINNGFAEKADRHIVLESLFRPTSDGIVKDDAAPDLSPSSILARFGSGK